MASEELRRIPNPDNLSAPGLRALVNLARHSNLSYEDAEKWLAQSAELYPYDAMPHAGMCNWLLPRWGGNNGEGGALVGALAARYPSPHGELLYARTALALTPMLDTQGLQYEAGFSILRVLEAVDPLLKQGNPARYEVELLIALAQNSQRPELVQKLAEYHVQHFGMPSRHAYQQNAVRAIAAAKEAGLVKAREAKR